MSRIRPVLWFAALLVILLTPGCGPAGEGGGPGPPLTPPAGEPAGAMQPPGSPAAQETPISETPKMPDETGAPEVSNIPETPDTPGHPETPDPSPAPAGAKKVAIDAGHQQRGNSEKEPIGPGAEEYKAKVASGTSGVSTGVPEYVLTLEVSLKLRDALSARGYEVFMIRETHDVDISNSERAAMAGEAGADIFVRIHANGSVNSGAQGMITIAPTKKNPYIPHLHDDCLRLSQCVLEEMVQATGAEDDGVWETDSMSGINWSVIPVTIVEMGYMTNPEEDALMQDGEYQDRLVTGIVSGIDRYFNG